MLNMAGYKNASLIIEPDDKTVTLSFQVVKTGGLEFDMSMAAPLTAIVLMDLINSAGGDAVKMFDHVLKHNQPSGMN